MRELANHRGRAGVGLLGAFRIIAQQNRGIMAAPCGDNVNGNAAIEQRCLMAAAKVVEAQFGEAELAGAEDKAAESPRADRAAS